MPQPSEEKRSTTEDFVTLMKEASNRKDRLLTGSGSGDSLEYLEKSSVTTACAQDAIAMVQERCVQISGHSEGPEEQGEELCRKWDLCFSRTGVEEPLGDRTTLSAVCPALPGGGQQHHSLHERHTGKRFS